MTDLEEPRFHVRLVRWSDAAPDLVRVRTVVFVQEQNVPVELELDGFDEHCVHALARSAAGPVIGTGRLMPDGRIGRMAVLAPWRRRGVGAAILVALLEEARRRGMVETYVHAQLQAKDFYARHGFVTEGEEYLEAGIAHIEMRANL